MKHLLMLLISVGTLGSVFAQNRPRHDRSESGATGYQNSKAVDQNSIVRNSIRERDAEIRRINRDFARQMEAVKNNQQLNERKKSRQIKMLEKQRDQQITEFKKWTV